MTLRIGELFAGYGGLGMGVQEVLGGEVAWFSEFDNAPSKILAHHWPDTPNYGDITKIDWLTVPPVDILTGGFPCQDVSLAGARAGLKDGTRSGLWSEFARAIEALQPSLVVIENVRGLLSASASKGISDDNFACVCSGANRRRGGDWDSRPIEGGDDLLLGAAPNRDDATGIAGPARTSANMGRLAQHDAARNSEVGGSVDMDDPGRAAGEAAGGTVTASAHQAGASAIGDPSRANQSRTAAAPGEQPSVDIDRFHAMRSDESTDASPEHEGADALCGECGGCLNASSRSVEPDPWGVGDGATRPVINALGAVLGDLADLGYDARWCGVRAADAGAPHGRYRVFILATNTASIQGRIGHGDDVQARGGTDGRRENSGRSAPENADIPTGDQRGLATPGEAEGGRSRANAGRRSGAPSADPRSDESERWRGACDLGSQETTSQSDREERERLRDTACDSGSVIADTDHEGLERIRRLEPIKRDADGRSSADTAWGDYEPAIRRWEHTVGRLAPTPTEQDWEGYWKRRASTLAKRRASKLPVGMRGSLIQATRLPSHRLSARLVEWMMGLSDGHVTAPAIGISRNEQLKALGNGVVPQQAALALRLLLKEVPG